MAFPPCNTIIQNFSQKSNRVQNFLYSSIGLWKRFLRLTGPVAGGFLSLTAALRLRVVVSPMEPLRGRVQRVQKVHRVQRGRYRLTAMSMYAAWRQRKPYNRACGPSEMHPYSPTGTSPKGKHVTGFSGRFTPLQIQFLCHPGGGSLLYAHLLNS